MQSALLFVFFFPKLQSNFSLIVLFTSYFSGVFEKPLVVMTLLQVT